MHLAQAAQVVPLLRLAPDLPLYPGTPPLSQVEIVLVAAKAVSSKAAKGRSRQMARRQAAVGKLRARLALVQRRARALKAQVQDKQALAAR